MQTLVHVRLLSGSLDTALPGHLSRAEVIALVKQHAPALDGCTVFISRIHAQSKRPLLVDQERFVL